MADEVHVTDAGRPSEAGEPIHLPGPSYLPVACAFGLTLADHRRRPRTSLVRGHRRA